MEQSVQRGRAPRFAYDKVHGITAGGNKRMSTRVALQAFALQQQRLHIWLGDSTMVKNTEEIPSATNQQMLQCLDCPAKRSCDIFLGQHVSTDRKLLHKYLFERHGSSYSLSEWLGFSAICDTPNPKALPRLHSVYEI
jgi:hypothetical protein